MDFCRPSTGRRHGRLGAGLTRTLLLTYTPALYGAGAACLAAAVMAMVIGRTRAMAGTGRQGA